MMASKSHMAKTLSHLSVNAHRNILGAGFGVGIILDLHGALVCLKALNLDLLIWASLQFYMPTSLEYPDTIFMLKLIHRVVSKEHPHLQFKGDVEVSLWHIALILIYTESVNFML